MKSTASVCLAFAIGTASLLAESAPHGRAGEGKLREPRIRQLSHGVAATRVPVTFAGCGIADIDGILSPGEWAGATSQMITVQTPAGAIPGTLYVMNDNMNVYFAVKYAETSAHYGSLSVEFDNDNNGVPFEAGDDGLVYNNQFGFFDDVRTATLFPEDTTLPGGRREGQGAYVNDGVNSVYEVAHPFHSYDVYDIAVDSGGSVGFFIDITIIDGPAIYDSYYPDAGVYDQITIQSCAPAILSGCGTPTINGIVGSGEWASAGQSRLSVATPQGRSVPGTLYVMNDSFNLYVALAYPQPALPALTEMILFFDSDNTGGLSFGDDGIVYQLNLGTTGFFDGVWAHACFPLGFCLDYDTNHGGTKDGAAALGNDGTRTAYEFAHPLNSGDVNDFAVSFGDTLAYDVSLLISSSQSVSPPDRADTVFGYYKLQICTPGPSNAMTDLGGQVESLAATNALGSKNADALRKDLVKASDNLQRGKTKQARNELGNFVSDVQKMIRKGDLSDRIGQPLIRAANSAMSQL